MPPALIPSDEEYASEEDSDFAPDAAPAHEDGGSSDSESEAEEASGTVKAKSKSSKRKRVGGSGDEAEDAGFENSGDEAIIKRGLKRRKKKGVQGRDEDDDESGEGGLVKTRNMRAQEKVEKRPLVNTSAATVDVEALWASMISGKPASKSEPIPSAEKTTAMLSPDPSLPPSASRNNIIPQTQKNSRSPSTLSDGPDSMVMIKRTYNFAGKVHTEQKLVPRNSAEAKLYLASLPDPSTTTAEPTNDPTDPPLKPKRPPRKARRSIFEPIVDGAPQRTDLHLGVRKSSGGVELVGVGTGKEKKLNTVEKSAMDWAGFVDKEGIADELDAAGKAKGAYKARQEFLARVERKKEEDSRRAKGL